MCGGPLMGCAVEHPPPTMARAIDPLTHAPRLASRLFLTEYNEFAGDNQKMTLEETIELTEAMGSIN